MTHRAKGIHSQESELHSIPNTDPAFPAFLQGLIELATSESKKSPPPVPTDIVSLAPTLPDSWQDLQSDYDALHRAHAQFLRKYGVLLPKTGSQQLLSLLFLFRHMGTLVPLEDLRAFIQKYVPGGSKDKQPRHLKYKGWHIVLGGKACDRLPVDADYRDGRGDSQRREAGEPVPKGYLMLVTDSAPSPDYVLDKRNGGIDRSTWHALCTSFGHRCAVCGKSGHLEKGHMDPAKGMTEDNLIPMCSACNNHASNDLVFDFNGRVVGLASERFVLSASLATRLRIFDALLNDRTVNRNRL